MKECTWNFWNSYCHFTSLGFPDSSGGKDPPAMQETPQLDSWFKKIHWRRNRLPTPVFLGFPCGSAGKESTCNVGDLGWIPGLGRSPGDDKGYPPQYSGLENFMDSIAHGVAKSQTGLRDFYFHFFKLSNNNEDFLKSSCNSAEQFLSWFFPSMILSPNRWRPRELGSEWRMGD